MPVDDNYLYQPLSSELSVLLWLFYRFAWDQGNAALYGIFTEFHNTQTTRIASVFHVKTLPAVMSFLLEMLVPMLRSLTIVAQVFQAENLSLLR